MLNGIAAASATAAWAVGVTGVNAAIPVILHWDGTKWSRQLVRHWRSGAILWGVAATSGRTAWAVGVHGTGKVLILAWNGTDWRQVPAPPGASGSLQGVAASSARNAWAVGATPNYAAERMRWNGATWTLSR
jgi:hypothetical protein